MWRSDNLILHTLAGCCRDSVAALSDSDTVYAYSLNFPHYLPVL